MRDDKGPYRKHSDPYLLAGGGPVLDKKDRLKTRTGRSKDRPRRASVRKGKKGEVL